MKKLTALALILVFALTACSSKQPNNGIQPATTSVSTGLNMLPARIDAFPEFRYDGQLESAELWVWIEDATAGAAADYIKQLQRAGFVDEGGGTYRKGNVDAWFDGSADEYTIVFTIESINVTMQDDPLSAILNAFPAFHPEQFGGIYSIDFDIIYQSPVPEKAIDDYVADMAAEGFVYSEDFDDYELEMDDRQYYLTIEDDDEYSWSVLYYSD